MSNFLRDFPTIIVPAGGQIVRPGLGSLFVIKEASAGFDWEADNSGKNFGEGGWEFDFGPDTFRRLTIYNRSTTAQLTIDARIGMGSGRRGCKFDYLRVRDSKTIGWAFTLADGATMAFPGVATSAATYVAHGVAAGARRKHFIITSRNVGGYLVVTNTATGSVIAVIDLAGYPGAFILESTENVTFTNNTAHTIDPTGATYFVAIAEVFNS